MATVNLTEEIYINESDISLDGAEDIVDLIENNSIDIVEVLALLNWELPDFQEAARQLDIELMIGFSASSGDDLYQAFKKLNNFEKRDFMTYISDCVVGYHDIQKSEVPNELR